MTKRLAWLSSALRKLPQPLSSSAAGRDAFSGNNSSSSSCSRRHIPWLGNNLRYFTSKSKLRVPAAATKPAPAVAAAGAEKVAAAGEAVAGAAARPAIKDDDGGVDEELKEYLRLRRIKEDALMAEMSEEESEESEGGSTDEDQEYEMEKEEVENQMWEYRDPRELTPVIEELEKRLGELLKTERPDDRRVAVVRLKLAQQYYASEEESSPDKVVSHANQALKVFGVGSDDSLEQGMCLALLGGAYRRLEQADVSLSYLRRALRYFEEKEQQGRDVVGEKLPVLQELGLTLLALGRLREAIDHLLEALELQEALLPPNDPVLGDEHRKVAEYLCDAMAFGDAKELCEKAIEIHSKDSGYYSADVGVDRRLMAIIYTSLGEQEKALEQFRIVKQIFVNEEDGDREVFYANVGIAEAQMALERYSDAIATLEGTSVPENDKLLQGILCPNLAKAFFLNDNKEEARKHCKHALEFHRENKTEGMGRHLVSIAALLDAMGDVEESITALKQAIVAFGDGNMAVNAKVHLGTQLVRYGRSEEALVCYKEALERMEAANKTTVSLLSLTAIAYMELQKFEAALELLERAKQAVEVDDQQQQQPSESNFGTLAVYQNLVKGYSSLGRHDEAISHQKLVVNELQRSKEAGKDAEGRLAEALLLLEKLSKRGEKVEEAPTAEAGG